MKRDKKEIKFKSGYVAIVGETNAGKSTLLNNIIREKVSIISPKVQTTRTKIRGIYNDIESQIVFIDTPGIHKVNSKLSTIMNSEALSTIDESDIILFLVSITKKKLSPFDITILKSLREKKHNVILLLNKVDKLKMENSQKKKYILDKISTMSLEYDFLDIIPIEAKSIKDAKKVVENIKKYLKEGPKYFDDDLYTDQTVREMCEEIIRSKALKLLYEEIPHGIIVEIEKFKERKTTKNEDIIDIEANIITKKKTHKGIIIGKDGLMLKDIGTYSRQDLERFLSKKVNLKLWVKVRENWMDNENYLNKFKKD